MKTKYIVSILGVAFVLSALFLTLGPGGGVQARESQQKIERVAPTVTKKLNADFVDNFHASASPKKNRLLPLDANSKFPDSVMPDSIQRRVSGTCAAGSSIRVIAANGTVTCETDDSGGGGGAGWLLTGNAGTNPPTHAVGTTDNKPLVLKTNNGERVRINANGNVGIGTTTPAHRLGIVGGPFWTLNNWLGAIEMNNASAIGWQKNSVGQSFGLGQTNGGFYFFRTLSAPGTTATAAVYDMTITDGGDIGIGTTTPQYKLDVVANDVNKFAVRKDTGEYILAVSHYGVAIQPYQLSGAAHVCYKDGYLSTCSSAAEYVPTIDGGSGFPETADLVSIAPNQPNPYGDTRAPFAVKKSDAACDSNLLGFILQPELGADGKKLNEHYLPLAIYGYFPAKVTVENGTIKRGDPLTSSSKPGHAMKATGACKIIGYALEDATKEGQIQVFADAGESSAAEVARLRGEVDALAQENSALKEQLRTFEERLDALENGAQVTQGEAGTAKNTVANLP